MLQTLVNRSLTEPVPSIPEGFEMTVWLVFGQTLYIFKRGQLQPLRGSLSPRQRCTLVDS
jgi:hypothetical protein